MNEPIRARRLAAAAAAAALAATAFAGTAAAVTVTGDVTGLDAATASATCPEVGLTVRIPVPNPHDEVPEGEKPPGSLSGIVFTVQRVGGVDLDTAAGWVAARAMSVEEAGGRLTGDPVSATTDDSGAAVFAGLEPGLYLVTAETPEDPDHDRPEFAPFLITLPTGADGDWNCDPVVHAKAAEDEPDPGPDDNRPPWPTPWPDEPGAPAPDDPGTPGKPDAPGKPGSPDSPGAPADPGKPGSGGSRLPVTGAAVTGLVGAAVLLVGAGLLAMRLGRRRADDE